MTKYKCPYCPKEFAIPWKLVNHVRQSGGNHGPRYSLPKGFDPKELKPFDSNVSTEGLANVSKPFDSNVSMKPIDSNVEVIEPPEKKIVENKVCPDCGSPKEDWININQFPNATEEERQEYDYVCPSCEELIKVKK